MSNRLFSEDPEKFGRELFKPTGNQGLNVPRLFKVGFALWCVWALIVLTGICGIGYVAWHFISKVW